MIVHDKELVPEGCLEAVASDTFLFLYLVVILQFCEDLLKGAC